MSNAARASTSLEIMPVEVLGRMGELIGGWSTFQLATLSGSRSLAAKFASPHCLRVLAFDFTQSWNSAHSHNAKIVETSLSKFPGLNCLDIRQGAQYGARFSLKALLSMPPTITSLTLACSSAFSLFMQPVSTEATHAPESLEMIDIGALMPNLVSLRVLTDCWTRLRTNSSIAATRFISALPRHLEHLTVRIHINSVDHSAQVLTGHWPESLKTIDIFGASLANFAPDLILHGLTTFTVFGDRTKLPFQPHQAPNLRAVKCLMVDDWCDLLDECPQVTSIHSDAMVVMKASTKFPSGLTRLSIDAAQSNIIFPLLPKGLTHFSADLNTASSESYLSYCNALPATLTHLALNFNSAVKIADFSTLPRTLTSLNLKNITYLRPEDNLKGLPRGLTSLTLHSAAKAAPFTAPFVKACLPRSLTSLELGPRCTFWIGNKHESETLKPWNRFPIEKFPRLFAVSMGGGNLSDSDLLLLPKQISLFGCSTVPFQGNLIDREAKSFSSRNPAPSLSRELPAVLRMHARALLDKSANTTTPTVYVPEDDAFHTRYHPEALHGPVINLQATNPVGYSPSLKHLYYHLTTPQLHSILWFTPSLTSLKAPLVLEAYHQGLPATLTSISVNKMELANVAEKFPALRVLKALYTGYSEESKLPETIEQLSVASLHPRCGKDLKALRKLKIYNSGLFTDNDLALLPRHITSFKLRWKTDRNAGGYYWYSRGEDKVLLSDAAALPPNLTVFDAPSVKMKISQACFLPLSLKKLVIHSATATFAEFETINKDFESLTDSSEADIMASGSKQLVTFEGRKKAQQALAKARTRSFLQTLLDVYLSLHRPGVQLMPKPESNESRYYAEQRTGPVIEGTTAVEPAQFAAKLARNLKVFSFAFRDMKHARTMKLRHAQDCGTEVSILGSRFSRALPPTLTYLHVSGPHIAADVHMPKFLPHTLVYLSVNGRLWNRNSLSFLPPSLHTLHLVHVRKWNVRYTESLGHLQALTSLRIDSHALCDQDVKNLPPSLKRLTLRSNSLTTGCLAVLPPQLVSFTFSSHNLSNEAVVTFITSHAGASIPTSLCELYRTRPSYRGEEIESLSALVCLPQEETSKFTHEALVALVHNDGYEIGAEDDDDDIPF